MSADLSAALAAARTLLRAMIRSAVITMADGLHRLPDGEADPDAASKAFAGLADAYRSISDEAAAPATLGDTLAIVAALCPHREILLRALERAMRPLGGVMRDDLKAGDGGGSRRIFGSGPGDAEDASELHRWGVLALVIDRGLGLIPPRVRALPGAHALAGLTNEIRSAINSDNFPAELPRLRRMWVAAFEQADRDNIADSELIYGWEDAGQ